MSIKKLRPRTREFDIADDSDLSLATFGDVNAVIDQANSIIDEINLELELIEDSITKYDGEPFQFTVKTDNAGASASNQFTINLDENYKYLITIDWGDGSTSTVREYNSPLLKHTYTSAGTYTVTIKGSADSIKFTSDPQKVLEIQKWGMLYLQPSNFRGCINMTVTATDVPTYGTDLSFAFFDCRLMADIPGIGAWDVSGVRNVSGMFEQCYVFNGDITTWDTSNISDMSILFRNARLFNQDISGWDTSNVSNMYAMFNFAYVFNQPIGNWNTSKVTRIDRMFWDANAFNQDVDTKTVNVGLPNEYVAWDVSNVTNMEYVFYDANLFNQPLGNWNTSNVTTMGWMFLRAYAFNQPSINNWDTSKVTNMTQMFKDTAFNHPLNNWNTGNVLRMDNMFENVTEFDQEIGMWDVSSVNNIESMFQNAQSFNNGGSDSIKNWDITNCKDRLFDIFRGAISFNQPIGSWDMSNITSLSNMLNGATSFNQDISTWNIRNITSFSNLLAGNSVMDTDKIDAIYINWSKQPLQTNRSLNLGTNTYSAAAVEARALLTDVYGWTIVDGGLV